MPGGGGGGGGWTPDRSAAGDRNPWLILGIISIATFMEVLDTAIANVSLRHIAGSLSASYDEATWVITSYLVSNAIVIPISGWLSDVVGRKRYYMISVALFTGASLLCGLAPNLSVLILARVIQGIGGGGLAPSEQSMLVDTFSPKQRGLAFAGYGLVVIAAPVLGPTLGGLITDNISWHWVFLINVPVGLMSLSLVGAFVAEPEALEKERKAATKDGLKVDIIGFLLIVSGLGCLEIALDRGQRDNWFSSPVITGCVAISILSLVALVPWELSRKQPIIDIRLFGRRNFAISSLLLMATGLIIFGTTQFIPQLLQEVLGYTATLAGLALTAGGVAAVVAMPFSGILSNKIDPRPLIGAAFLVQGLALWHMTHLSTDLAFKDAALARMFQAIGLPFLFIPITNIAYVGLKPEQSNQASGLMNVARNLGGSMGISLVQTLLAQREQFHQSRIVEDLNPLNPNYRQAVATLAHQAGQSGQQGMQMVQGQIYALVQKQSQMLAYLDSFWVMMWCIFLLLPLIFLLQGKPAGESSGGAA